MSPPVPCQAKPRLAELWADVDPFVLHLFAALAEKERSLISSRTRQALAAAKARKLSKARKSAVTSIKASALYDAQRRYLAGRHSAV